MMYYMAQYHTDGSKENKFSNKGAIQHPTNTSQPEIVESLKIWSMQCMSEDYQPQKYFHRL